MSRRRRPRKAPTAQSQKAAEPAADPIRAELLEDFELTIKEAPGYDPTVGEPLLQQLLHNLRRGETDPELADRLAECGLAVHEADGAAAGEEEVEPAAEELTTEPDEDFDGDDFDELERPGPGFEFPAFEWGPLAAGIQMLEAMLTEAKAGYIANLIARLEEAIHESFTPDERALMAEAASRWTDAAGLPDVPAAYQALVVHRATGEGVT